MENRSAHLIIFISFLFFSFFCLTTPGSIRGEVAQSAMVALTEQGIAPAEQVTAVNQANGPLREAMPELVPELLPMPVTMSVPMSMAVQEDRSRRKELTAMTQFDSNPVAEKAVDKNLSLFSERLKERFSIYLERSGRYLELMKDILKAKSIPEDIVFLPIIESGFNPNAYSVARAVGTWQFMSATAKRYGLKIDWWKDERKDPVKSTEAAASYLSDLHDMFGSWSLAMAAYNAGEGKILRALKRSKSDNYWALQNTTHIRRETKDYVPKFIAASLIASNPAGYGFENLSYHAPLQYDEVILEKPLDIDIAARCAETTTDIIKEFNPELRRWSTPPNVNAYALRIPVGKKEVFMENLTATPEESRFSIETYIVKKGDTIKNIAGKIKVPINVILELNGNGIMSVKAGEKINLPPKNKFVLDRDDKARTKRVSSRKFKKNKKVGKKILVTHLNKKEGYVND